MLARMRRGLPVLAAALLGATLAADTAAARRAPCTEGAKAPKCTFQSARAVFIADGDTIRVRLGGKLRNIRFTGINAMELTRYSKFPNRRRGACSGLEATALVERLIKRSKRIVRLSAQNPASRTGHRLRRAVAVRVNGRWVDLGRIVMEQGYALWLPNGAEWAHNREYHELAEQAAAARRGLYNPAACAGGPAPGAPLAVDVNWDADGMDEQNLNGEWVDIRNLGATDVSLAGWWVRDSWMRGAEKKVTGFVFPSYAVVPAGGSVRLYVGCGENTADRPGRFHWCQKDSVFENPDGRKGTGDGGYLFDPRGNLRASMTYPCAVACGSPLQGRVRLTVQPKTPETINVTNVSGEPVDLAGHLLKLHLKGMPRKFIWGYPFGAGSVLAPGETLQVHPDGSPERNSRLDRFLGRGQFVLTDGGNVVSLRTASDVVVACEAWGRSRC
jgi:endonuclease YncB( thermonuclease family)